MKEGDVKNILKKYNLGEFKSLRKVIKDDKVSLSQIIETDRGQFFMKLFRKFNLVDKQGIEVMQKLRKEGFPIFKTYNTKNNKPYIKHGKNTVVLFEYVKIKEDMDWVPMNKERIKNFARTLARFHVLTKKIKLKSVDSGNLKNTKKLIKNYYKKRKKYSKKYQEILGFMNKEIHSIKHPKKEYKTGYYSEFNPGHVIFEKNMVKYVIDWSVGYDFAFFDLGSSMTACFSSDGEKFSYSFLKEYIKNYNRTRKLSKWEKNHLYESLMFGCIKYGIWSFADIKKGGMAKEKDLDETTINMVRFIMKTSKETFNRKFHRQRKP